MCCGVSTEFCEDSRKIAQSLPSKFENPLCDHTRYINVPLAASLTCPTRLYGYWLWLIGFYKMIKN